LNLLRQLIKFYSIHLLHFIQKAEHSPGVSQGAQVNSRKQTPGKTVDIASSTPNARPKDVICITLSGLYFGACIWELRVTDYSPAAAHLPNSSHTEEVARLEALARNGPVLFLEQSTIWLQSCARLLQHPFDYFGTDFVEDNFDFFDHAQELL
jgi:hypothetical protein